MITAYNALARFPRPTPYAELNRYSAACYSVKYKYLTDCTLYVPLEPCAMCAGAIVWCKPALLVFGALDEKSGGAGSVFNITSNRNLNHRVDVIHGVMENEA